MREEVTKPEHATEYLEFWRVKEYPKTSKWEVVSKSGSNLGYIKWFARWRQYCFFPYEGTVFNRECMRDINVFIESQMNARKK
ncbi:hypothetical protein LCGC14_1939890 [marine sediment metagenome]|uniref:Uncharacterized protein n=1 Tax=marine sediment metagenome TaxID=412755 RepID=A0A0F9FKK1_9ZZZZ